MREWQEVHTLQANITQIYNNNLRIGLSAIQKVERQAGELERQAQEARVAYQTQREKDEEKVRREQEGIAQTKKDYEESGRGKRQHAEMEQPVVQQQGGGDSSVGRKRQGTERLSSQPGEQAASSEGGLKMEGGKGGDGSFDVTAWNYGDPVPDVERPPEFDKPQKKTPCRLKDTDCLDPLYAEDELPGQQKGPTTRNPWSQEIEQKVKGGLLSSEQIRQDIEQKVRGGRSSGNRSEGPCDENLGCPDNESGANGPGKDLLAKLNSDLERIQNSQAGTAGGVLQGESFDTGEGSSFDKTAMLRSLRSGLGAYREGKQAYKDVKGFGGGMAGSDSSLPPGQCPETLGFLASRLRTRNPQMVQALNKPITSQIAEAGGSASAIAATRAQVEVYRRNLNEVQTSGKNYGGKDGAYIDLMKDGIMVNEAFINAVQCRANAAPVKPPVNSSSNCNNPDGSLKCLPPTPRMNAPSGSNSGGGYDAKKFDGTIMGR